MLTVEEQSVLDKVVFREKLNEIHNDRNGKLSKAYKIARLPYAQRVTFGERVIKVTEDCFEYNQKVRMVFDRSDEKMCEAVLIVLRGLI